MNEKEKTGTAIAMLKLFIWSENCIAEKEKMQKRLNFLLDKYSNM